MKRLQTLQTTRSSDGEDHHLFKHVLPRTMLEGQGGVQEHALVIGNRVHPCLCFDDQITTRLLWIKPSNALQVVT